jgi:zinc protease
MKLWIATLALIVSAVTARAEIDIQEVTSPGGIDAWLVEERAIPFIALELRFRGGASLESADARGVTNLMVGLLDEGAGERDARAFAEAAEAIALRYDFDVSDDTFSVSARFLTETADEAIALLRDALVEPRFDADAIERVRAQVLAGIRADSRDPNTLASREFDRIAFGDHPYGSAYEGTADSVAALTRDDLVTAHRGLIARDRVFVGVSGDIGAEDLGAMLDALLGDLPETGAPQTVDAELAFEGGVTVVPFDTPQSVALFGHEGLARNHPDFLAAFVMNTVLGGGGYDDARLMTEVREKRGLTYGVYSFQVPKEHGPLYLGQVASANDRIAEAITVIQDVWRDMSENGLTQEELDAVKTYLTGAYPLRFDGNAPIASTLAGMQLDEMPIDYVLTRNDMVNALTLDDINRVAAELLNPEALRFVVVGQPEGLQDAQPGQ